MTTERKIAAKRYDFKKSPMMIREILNAERYGDLKDGERALGGFRLPAFQRPLVWSEDQKVALIQSIWEGFDIGTYAITQDLDNLENDNLILDGQQRISAILDYVADKFKVYGMLYSELTERDHRVFSQTIFPRVIVKPEGDNMLRDYYNRMNFSGVHHTEDQRA